MPSYKVRCYKDGVWDKDEPHNIEAQNEQEAAENICGEGVRLIERGKLGQLRAEVWQLSSPDRKKHFYVRATSNIQY